MEDLRGMADEVGSGLTRHLRTVGIAAVAVVVLLVLGWLALTTVTQAPISLSFDKQQVKAGESTSLKVTVVNTGETDAKDVMITIVPESAAITVADATRTEATIGSKARREFEFNVNVSSSATPGSYKITSTVTGIGGKAQSTSAYLEVE